MLTRREWIGLLGGLAGGSLLLAGLASAPTVEPREALAIVADLAGRVEAAGALPGFRTFALATAQRESGGNTMAQNRSASEVAAGRNLYRGAIRRGWFDGNPFGGQFETMGSAGLYGFLGATGLAAGGHKGPFAMSSPYVTKLPTAATAMAADYADRLIRNRLPELPPSERVWLAVARGWASPELVADWQETKKRSRAVRERLVKNLQRCCGLTQSEAIAFARSPARRGDYPGAWSIWNMLRREGDEVAA